MKIALADPNTLEDAFKAHAHRTDSWCIFSSKDSPAGNGIPIKNATGAMPRTVISIFTPRGNPTKAVVTGDTRKASTTTNTEIAQSVPCQDARLVIQRLLQ